MFDFKLASLFNIFKLISMIFMLIYGLSFLYYLMIMITLSDIISFYTAMISIFFLAIVFGCYNSFKDATKFTFSNIFAIIVITILIFVNVYGFFTDEPAYDIYSEKNIVLYQNNDFDVTCERYCLDYHKETRYYFTYINESSNEIICKCSDVLKEQIGVKYYNETNY